MVILGLAYLGLLVSMVASGSGYPPVEPFQTSVNILVLITAAWMVFFWSILNHITPGDRKLFSQASLAMIVIFAALTSINRYVALTVVKQSLAAGNTNGLQWFLPYGWPSVMLALEILAWGFFFGLACLLLAPVFSKGRLERSISWILIVTGILSLLAVAGQMSGVGGVAFNPFTLAGVVAWGPGLTTAAVLMAIWFHKGPV